MEARSIGWSGADNNGLFCHNFDFKNVGNFRRAAIDDPLSNEPTYLTFGIDIDTSSIVGLDKYHGLCINPLFNTNSINSAYQFLRQRNYSYKADKLYEFIQLINLITKEYPWYLDSISGLKDLWKNNSDTSKGFTTDKVKLTFTTLESLNLNVTRLASLYREFAYDMIYRREILPDNLQWFSIKVIVSECRNLYIDLEDYKNPDYNYLNDYNNYLEFDCDMCTFDFSESLPFDQLSSSLIGNNQGPSTNKFSINVGRVIENHSFGLANTYYISKNQQDAEKAAELASQSAPESSEDREITKKEQMKNNIKQKANNVKQKANNVTNNVKQKFNSIQANRSAKNNIVE